MDLPLEKLRLSVDENKKTVRRLSDMAGFYADQEAARRRVGSEDPVIYEVYARENDNAGDLSYAVTVINPGDVGGEYFMTKGHFHDKPAGEIYLGLGGKGLLLMQNTEGSVRKEPLEPGRISYVPKGWAHRSVNTGDSPLRFLAVYASDAGHDYSAIESEGFRERVKKS